MPGRAFLVVATIVTIIAVGAMTGWAADGDGFGFNAEQPDAAARWQQMLERFDTNKDGKLSQDEFQGGDEVFARRDKNGDGFITQDEFTAPAGDQAGGERGQGWGQMLQKADKNGDGQITREEWPGGDEGFNRLDKNGDGVIDQDEMPKFDRPGGAAGAEGDRPGGGQGEGMRDMDPAQRWQKMLERMDANQDGKISEEEFQGPERFFGMLDRNGDGAITEEEGKAVGGRDGDQGQGQGRDRDPAQRFQTALRMWDADGDGKLSKVEWKGREEMFAQLDADGDTFITEQEFVDNMGQPFRPRNPAQELMGMMDTDADGRISAEEWNAYFEKADAGGDGFLTIDELMKAMRPPAGDMPPPPAGDAPPPVGGDAQ